MFILLSDSLCDSFFKTLILLFYHDGYKAAALEKFQGVLWALKIKS